MSAQRFVEAFIVESHDLLAEIDGAALALESGAPSKENVNLLFRCFHTIKGSAAVCGFEAIVDFTHYVEHVLDLVREASLPVTPKLIDLVLRSEDQIASLLDAERGATPPDSRSTKKLIADLCAHAGLAVGDGVKEKAQERETETAFLF
jgi:two-component system chemotaxis sensor kinase CheA